MITRFPIKFVTKTWGTEEWLVNNELYCAKELVIRPGGCSSTHYHKTKHETFLLRWGRLVINIEKKDYEMVPGDSVVLPPMTPHHFRVPIECVYYAVVLEVSTHHDDSDVVRLNLSQLMTHATGRTSFRGEK